MDADRGDLVALSTTDLEARLSSLAARIAAAECEFLTLLAEFDARQGFGESGMKSTSRWLSWRTGIRLGVARERVRVARALRAPPLVREAFAAGRLSYCKDTDLATLTAAIDPDATVPPDQPDAPPEAPRAPTGDTGRLGRAALAGHPTTGPGAGARPAPPTRRAP